MIALEGIHKVYRNGALEVQALKPTNLIVEKGDYVAIIGPSGSGKSTLMNILGCLDIPSGGTYKLDHQEVQSLTEKELAKVRNKKIGFVFQNFNLLARQTVQSNVELPMLYGGVTTPVRKDRAISLLEKVGLGGRVHHRPTELSGGQKQRVAIARALTMNPSILLADEPTGNLDQKSSHEIMALFTQLNNEGSTVIVITHEMDIAEHAKRILRFGDGEIIEDRRKGSVRL
ncbi:ABC transporter ATP-binding protein [Paenibacillus sedimenti]|uniref:ABC transporter ATP-binding protein n=1 Tax=Paenibacillus sedimenti TaxID=2770274 RepID=A0A926KKM2_9BACL|nr:ABC transporter ATP-binding protein [Paenibacillus sedimenti]MBD0378721.1 ABC transporter ATP-binding protein [Paenibacillus sedimenti]